MPLWGKKKKKKNQKKEKKRQAKLSMHREPSFDFKAIQSLWNFSVHLIYSGPKNDPIL